MADTWVMNASPLILLGRINQLDLISGLAQPLFIPEAVIAELEAGRFKDGSAESTVSWARNFQSAMLPCPGSISSWELGAGETQVLVCALEHHAWVVVDDLMARRCAKAHGIRVIGTL